MAARLHNSTARGWLLAGTVVVLGAAGVYGYFQHRQKSPAQTAEGPVTLKQLEEQLRSRSDKAKTTPEAKAIREGNAQFVVDNISGEKTPRERIDLFTNLIYGLDQAGTTAFTAADEQRIRQAEITFLKKLASDHKPLGELARARSLSIRMMEHLSSPVEGSTEEKQVLAFVKSLEKDESAHMLMMEYIATWKHFPNESKTALLKEVMSKNAQQSQLAINVLSRMQDRETLNQILHTLYGSISKIGPVNQPLMVKTIGMFSEANHLEPKPLMDLSRVHGGDPAWDDVLVSLCEHLTFSTVEEKALDQIAKNSQSVILRERAGRVLTRNRTVKVGP